MPRMTVTLDIEALDDPTRGDTAEEMRAIAEMREGAYESLAEAIAQAVRYVDGVNAAGNVRLTPVLGGYDGMLERYR